MLNVFTGDNYGGRGIIIVNSSRWRKLGVGKGGEGGGLIISDEGLKEACVVVGDTTIEVAKEIALSMVGWKMEKEDQIEDGEGGSD